jgi:catechol 2,3-dioxygenase-like lactoylglutathione lyase family enzyme
MTVELNHTIIPAKDKWRSAKFLADILGLEAGPEWSHFVPVRTSNGVTLDYADATEFRRQHYAFLVSEREFDAALSRIKSAGIAYFADFNRDGRGEYQPPLRWPRPLFRRPRRPFAGNHHAAVCPSPERWTETAGNPS